jgi:hypothetical protein
MLSLFTSAASAQAPAAKTASSKAPAAAADGVQALGIFALTTETSLVIRGVPGQISVVTKPAHELRFLSRAKDKSGGERPLAVAFDGTTATLTAPPGATLPDGTLRVEAPSTFAVRVEAEDGTVLVDGFAGAVGIKGKRTVVRAQALTGPLEADVEAGSLTLTNLAGSVTARIRAACALTGTNLRGAFDLKSQDATFKVQGIGGPCTLEARGGSGELAGIAAGGTLNLSEATLRLTGGKGDVTITSDASVTFSNMVGAMRLELDGGILRGQGNQGPVAVRSRRTEINLEGVSGELNLDVTRGNVAVQRSSGPVDAVIFAGDAKLNELQGPLRLEMDGGTAAVSWTTIAGDKDSLLKNNGGDISVRFPGNAVCKVSATTKSGKVTSDIASLKAAPDATEVSGSLAQGQKPLITIEADGNIHLTGGGAGGVKPPPPPPPPPPS